MSRVLPTILLIAFTVWCLVSIIQAGDAVRHLPRWAWLLLVLFFPLVGGIAYVLVGRPTPSELAAGPGGRPLGGNRGRRQAPRGPDDDDDFLRKL